VLDKNDSDGVVRLSYDYGRCPRCELVTPLVPDRTTGDPLLGIAPVFSGKLRCGLCARALVDRTAAPLDFRRSCPDCGGMMLAPADAAMIACPNCDASFLNPANPPDVRTRVAAVLAERARLAEIVAALDRRIAEAQTSLEQADLHDAVDAVAPAWTPPSSSSAQTPQD
jgi:ribosomal protein L37AE/L43A